MTRAEQLDRSDPNIAAIRKSGCVSIKAHLRDGSEKPVAIAKGGNRWRKLVEVLDALDWERLECLDVKGGVLHVVESDEDTEEDFIDDDAPEMDTGMVKAVAKICFGIMRNTLAESRKMFEVQIKGNAELVQAMTEGLHQLQEANRLALQVHIAQAAGGEDKDETAKLMQMVLMAGMRGAFVPTPPSQPKQVAAPRPSPQQTKPGGA